MGEWGSTSGWNHAISYYLKAIATGIGAGVLVFMLADSGSEGSALLLAALVVLGWPLIMTVLMFNEVDRLVSRRINQYHQNAWGHQQAPANAANAQQRQGTQANQQHRQQGADARGRGDQNR